MFSRYRGCFCAVVIWCIASVSIAQTTSPTPPTAEAPPAESAKAPELFKLKAEDLIKQAQVMLDKADTDYRAQVRALATAEQLLAETRKKVAETVVPPAATPGDPKVAMDAARARKTAADDRLKLVKSTKAQLDRLAAASDACQSAETAFLNTLDDLRAYDREIDLRVQDKTLAAKDIPAALADQAMAARRSEIASAREKRKTRAAAVVKEQNAASKDVEDAEKTSLAADAELAQASGALAKQEKSQELKKRYEGKKPADLGTELSALAEEGIGLKGTFELGLARIKSAIAEADRLRKVVEASKPPEVKIPQISRPEDLEQAATGTQTLIDFYTARAKDLEGLKGALEHVMRLGTEFGADATVSSEHLFKMRVIAEVIKKAGDASVKLIPEAVPDRVLAAERAEAADVATVQAAVERAKADATVVEKQAAENLANLVGASTQLSRLRQSQSATIASLGWEAKLKAMDGAQVVEAFAAASKSLQEKLATLEKEQGRFKSALAAAADLKARIDALKDPFLRAAEEAAQGEKPKLLGELRKDAGLDRAATAPPEAPKPTPPAAADDKKPAVVVEKKPEPSDLEKAAAALQAFQQGVAGRLRVLEEREALSKNLLSAIADWEKISADYAKALSEARQLAMQRHSTAIDVKKRVGKGEVGGDKIPAELTAALRPELLARLDNDMAALLVAESQFKQDKESLQKPDPEAQLAKTLTREVLTLVGQRLDLQGDLRRLDAAYKTAPKDRSPGEAKRMEEEASERQDAEAASGTWLLGIDTSKRSKALSELLESDYRDLVDLEHKEDNLRQQRQIAQKLVDLSMAEQAAITRFLPILEKQVATLQAAREEEAVLTRARLKPEQADELLKAFRATTGRLLARPVPLGEKEKAQKVAELADELFEKTLLVAAARNWQNALASRLAPTAIKAEAGAYQDEVARLNAVSGANVRRIEALSGQRPPEPGSPQAATVTARQKFPATGGSIASTRHELTQVRTQGVRAIGLKLLAILVAAFLLPILLMPLLRRAMGFKKKQKNDEHGNTQLVMSALGVFVKTAIWIVAIAFMLSTLGFDVTAIVAGLGIGGLAIGLAAQPVISDVISAVIIFAERKFTIGDVIRIGGDDPAKVVGLSWRGTQLKGSDGLVVNVPNRNLTSAVIRNLTREGRTFDTLTINITTEKDTADVLAVIKKAAESCKFLAAEVGHAVKEFTQKGASRVIKYQLWWYLADYEIRNQTREEVFTRIGQSLATADMAGTEITLA